MIGDHWSDQYADTRPLNARWWQSDHIVRAINKQVCGSAIPGLSHGLYRVVKTEFGHNLPAPSAISVGAGWGLKEMEVIHQGLVSHFDLYELSEVAVQRGRQLAKDHGLENRMTFHIADAFTSVTDAGSYDLVFWNNALHHMADVRAAVRWSHHILKPGGLFVMDDYVGATHMQWPAEMLEISTRFRQGLPAKYLVNPRDPSDAMDIQCVCPDEDDLIAADPSECADAGNILQALADIFPNVHVKLTGGGVYHLGLSDVLHNIVEAGDTAELDRAMRMDAECLAKGLTQYGVAYGTK